MSTYDKISVAVMARLKGHGLTLRATERELLDCFAPCVAAMICVRSAEHMRANLPEHTQETRHNRQMCCEQCHDCGGPLVQVLDGELWCATCQVYR